MVKHAMRPKREKVCDHKSLTQTSELMVRWSWERNTLGVYEPAETYDKVLHEETVDFKCADCDEEVYLTDDATLDADY